MLKQLTLAALFVAASSAAAFAFPPIPKGNHYTCYPATFTDKFVRRAATVRDQMGAYRVIVVGISRVCMPAYKTVEGQTFEPVDQRAHLTCYKIEPTSKLLPKLVDVVTNDQFGGHTNVRLQPPNELCLPAGKLKMN